MTDRMLPVHPGEILNEEFLKPMGISQTRLALDTGMPQSRIQGIIAEKRGISADTAVRLARLLWQQRGVLAQLPGLL